MVDKDMGHCRSCAWRRERRDDPGVFVCTSQNAIRGAVKVLRNIDDDYCEHWRHKIDLKWIEEDPEM